MPVYPLHIIGGDNEVGGVGLAVLARLILDDEPRPVRPVRPQHPHQRAHGKRPLRRRREHRGEGGLLVGVVGEVERHGRGLVEGGDEVDRVVGFGRLGLQRQPEPPSSPHLVCHQHLCVRESV